MGRTNIEWATDVWNPTVGCTKVSPGCAHCFAESVDHRFDHDGVGKLPWAFPASRGGRGVTLHPDRLEQPLRWKKPRRIFVNSMSDLFHEDVPDDFIEKVFAVMAVGSQHIFQVLTKRPERMRFVLGYLAAADPDYPLSNLWAGASVESQHWAERRRGPIKELAEMGWFTWVSYEPALQVVDWSGWEFLGWAVSGGESGPEARPSHPDCHRNTRDWCQENGIPFFFKQWGEWRPLVDEPLTKIWKCVTPDGYSGPGAHRHPDYRVMGKVGKKAAGAMLDGREWREFPRDYQDMEASP